MSSGDVARIQEDPRQMEATFPDEAKRRSKADYWAQREDAIYLAYVSYIVRTIGRDAKTIIDVGSNACDYINWFYWIPKKESLDRVKPYRGDGVKSIKADFFDWQPPRTYDVALCLEVLEHVDDPERFARKLLSMARHVVVSIPYMWPEVRSHQSHYLTEDSLYQWMGRKANYIVRASEPFTPEKNERIVAYFNRAHPNKVYGRGVRLQRRPVSNPTRQGEEA